MGATNAGRSPTSQSPVGNTTAETPAQNPGTIAAVSAEERDVDDSESGVVLDEGQSSTASVASSILRYRTIQGRTYHSERHETDYWTPNDEQQSDSIDLSHHYLTLLLGGKLELAPIPDDIQAVVDIGTGTGIWAIDFADAHPSAQVTGTDLSPMQPAWVPPNLKFEIDDATKEWTWPENTFDFVHLRYLVGAVENWESLMREAYRCCKPGGWVQSCEVDGDIASDDGTAETELGFQTWTRLFREGGAKIGRSFNVIADDLQRPAIEAAGFTDIHVVNYKVPIGGWPRDTTLAEIGRCALLALTNDMQGYTLFIWDKVLGWDSKEYQIFLMTFRSALASKTAHPYFNVRYVYARKPEKKNENE